MLFTFVTFNNLARALAFNAIPKPPTVAKYTDDVMYRVSVISVSVVVPFISIPIE